MLADVLERPVSVARDPDQAVARGAASLALFRHGTIDRAHLEGAVRTQATYEPLGESVDRYREVSARFEKAVAAVKQFHGA